MTTIDPEKKICTHINVFTVAPEKHLGLYDVLKAATEKIMSKLPGYISSSIHISDDKRTIASYMQWASREDFEAMLQNEEAQEHMEQAVAIATEVRPVTYDSIWTHSNKN